MDISLVSLSISFSLPPPEWKSPPPSETDTAANTIVRKSSLVVGKGCIGLRLLSPLSISPSSSLFSSKKDATPYLSLFLSRYHPEWKPPPPSETDAAANAIVRKGSLVVGKGCIGLRLLSPLSISLSLRLFSHRKRTLHRTASPPLSETVEYQIHSFKAVVTELVRW
ncbi:hypothetical protein L1887_01998 [Cichorium endivia]|nr:hypothetical protein L1887_01998 [Cichorium endivia]